MLVTGVGKAGQAGEVVAAAFARAGDRVIVVSREVAESEARAAELRRHGGDVTAYGADLAAADEADRLAARVVAAHGERLDALVHLAGGWMPGAPVVESTPEQWERIFAINLLTAVHTARAFVPLVRPARGAMVFFASEAALPGARVGGMAAYAAAKAGVVALARALAQEEHAHGVRVNALAPGAIRTAANEASMGRDVPYVEREDVASSVLWLCSPAAAAVSGEVIRLTAGARPPGAAGEHTG